MNVTPFQADEIDLVAPSLSQGAPPRFDIADGSQWSYSYSSVIEGTLSPFKATVSMSDELQPFVTASVSNAAIKLSYDG